MGLPPYGRCQKDVTAVPNVVPEDQIKLRDVNKEYHRTAMSRVMLQSMTCLPIEYLECWILPRIPCQVKAQLCSTICRTCGVLLLEQASQAMTIATKEATTSPHRVNFLMMAWDLAHHNSLSRRGTNHTIGRRQQIDSCTTLAHMACSHIMQPVSRNNPSEQV